MQLDEFAPDSASTRPLGRRTWLIRASSIAAVAILLMASSASAAHSRQSGGQIQIIKGAQYQFSEPIQPYGVGGRIWLVNAGSGLTILNASDGSLFKLFEGSPDNLPLSPILAVSGPDVWAIGGNPGPKVDLVELSGSSGRILRILHVANTGLSAANSMQVVGNRLWFTSSDPQALEEINLSTGTITRSLKSDVKNPLCLQVTNGHVWVVQGNLTLTEYSASTGALLLSKPLPPKKGDVAPFDMTVVGTNLWIPMGLQVIVWSTTADKVVARFTAPALGLKYSVAIAGNSSHVWVTNRDGNSVTEIDPVALHRQAVIKGAVYGFSAPYGDLVYDGRVWVANLRDSVTAFPAT
jgi:hypothetical protein